MEREDCQNYFELLQYWCAREPQKDFFVIDEKRLSYQQMLEQVQRLAAQAKEAGIRADMDVLLLADDVVTQLQGFLAAMAMHVRPILLHHGLADEEIEKILQENHLAGLWQIKKDAMQFVPATCQPTKHIEADILGVLSSGSTGVPKVMYRTYHSWAGFFHIQNKIFLVDNMTKMFLHGSLSFTGNLNSLLSVLYEGGTIVTCQRLAVESWAKLFVREKINCIYLIPTKLSLLTQRLSRTKATFDQVQSLFTGSQLLTADGIRALQAIFPKAKILLYYGASELNYITYAEVTDPERNPENLGKPFPEVEVTIKDELIYVTNDYHVSGLQLPACIRDTGHFNEKGELIFTGRRENWINKGGFKINTERLRQKLLQIDGVEDAVILPVADKLRGTTAVAWLVAEKACEEREVRQKIRSVLQPVEIPDKIILLSALPLNDRGKIDRKQLLSSL